MGLDRTTKVSVTITTAKSMDHRDPSHVNLRVTDDASDEALVDVEIDAWEWWDLCTGSHRHFDAFVSPHLTRVGKVMLNDVVDVPRDVTQAAVDGIGYDREHMGHRKAAGEDAARAYAAGLPDADTWESLSPRETNHGWQVIRRRWVHPDTPEAVDRAARRPG